MLVWLIPATQVGCAVLNLSLVFSVLCEGERPVLGKAFVASNAPTPGILRFTTKTCQKWGCAVKVCMNSGFCCWPVVKYLVKSYGFRAWSYFLHWGSLFFFFFRGLFLYLTGGSEEVGSWSAPGVRSDALFSPAHGLRTDLNPWVLPLTCVGTQSEMGRVLPSTHVIFWLGYSLWPGEMLAEEGIEAGFSNSLRNASTLECKTKIE